ncbi:hypothetical protein BDK51DRAFT_47061 [Blyttiomyces helicus]|uniref:Uncharacterized protein n=1 Tax=Blyttiomyces helicus TaxID=388810 RepID=A0A4P9W295_9FUNG|nr:hypothetical protein BDK51DRAFT_47061 [Blyttiomyces helicus]|eukprot:RKO86331.1 hypothetical protein BDK51DRAFT_47061 [Blyttiomyces helicus]
MRATFALVLALNVCAAVFAAPLDGPASVELVQPATVNPLQPTAVEPIEASNSEAKPDFWHCPQALGSAPAGRPLPNAAFLLIPSNPGFMPLSSLIFASWDHGATGTQMIMLDRPSITDRA